MDSPASPRRLLEPTQTRDSQLEALRVLGRSTMRLPGSLPYACSTTGPVTIPPSPSPRPVPLRVHMRNLGISRRRRGLELELWTTRSMLKDLVVELHKGRARVARARLAELSEPPRTVVLRVLGRAPTPGHYTVIVRHGRRVLLRRGIRVR